MGVSIREVLQSKFFRDYYVIAGVDGLDREMKNAVNVIAINRYITKINDTNSKIQNSTSNNFSRKIENIIIKLSEELNSPITISDIVDKNIIRGGI